MGLLPTEYNFSCQNYYSKRIYKVFIGRLEPVTLRGKKSYYVCSKPAQKDAFAVVCQAKVHQLVSFTDTSFQLVLCLRHLKSSEVDEIRLQIMSQLLPF